MKVLLHSRGKAYLVETNPKLPPLNRKHKILLGVGAGVAVAAAVGLYLYTRPSTPTCNSCAGVTCGPGEICDCGRCIRNPGGQGPPPSSGGCPACPPGMSCENGICVGVPHVGL